MTNERVLALRRSHVDGEEFRLPEAAAIPETGQAMDPAYEDPVAALHPDYTGRWLAGFAPVGHTEFTVIVQQRYDEAVDLDQKLFLDLLLWTGIALLLAAGGVGGMTWYSLRRDRKALAAT